MNVTAQDIADAREDTMTTRMAYDKAQTRYSTLLDVAVDGLTKAGITLSNTNSRTIEEAVRRL